MRRDGFKFKRHKYLNFKVGLTYNISKFNEPWIYVPFYSLLPDQTGTSGTIIQYLWHVIVEGVYSSKIPYTYLQVNLVKPSDF